MESANIARRPRRSISISCFILAAALTLLCGCGAKAPDAAPSPTAETEATPATVTISEIISEEGVFTDQWQQEYEYYYHVPQIDADTAGATAVNADIAAVFGATVNSNMESMGSGMSLTCYSVSWEEERCGDFLALVLKAGYDNDYEDYGVYNYDMAEGMWLDNSDVISRKGIGEDDFLDAVRREALRYYDEMYFQGWSENDPGSFNDRRSFTLSYFNINSGLMLYLDPAGDVNVITPIGSQVGAGLYYRILKPDFGEALSIRASASCSDYLEAAIDGRTLTLTFRNTRSLSDLLDDIGCYYEPHYDVEPCVNGLYSDYADIFCASIGSPAQPFVFLLTDDGRVEYVDVACGLKGEYFCSSGPVPGLENITSFVSAAGEDGIETVFAVDADGGMKDAAPLIAAVRAGMGYSLTGSWSATVPADVNGGTHDCCYSLTLQGTNETNLHSNVAELSLSHDYAGTLTYLGMTEDGAVYQYRFEGTEAVYEGCVALFAQWGSAELPDDYVLHCTHLGGASVFGAAVGEVTELPVAYG